MRRYMRYVWSLNQEAYLIIVLKYIVYGESSLLLFTYIPLIYNINLFYFEYNSWHSASLCTPNWTQLASTQLGWLAGTNQSQTNKCHIPHMKNVLVTSANAKRGQQQFAGTATGRATHMCVSVCEWVCVCVCGGFALARSWVNTFGACCFCRLFSNKAKAATRTNGTKNITK